MVKADMGARVQRLLNGQFDADSFTRLFMYLRSNSYGIQSIIEIGHFIAHPEKRTKGLTTEYAQDFLNHFVWLANRLVPGFFPTLPVYTKAMEGNFRRLSRYDSGFLKREMGMNETAALKILRSALSKLPPDDHGPNLPSDILTSKENNILLCCENALVLYPLFTEQDLFRDFCAVLMKNGLLKSTQRSTLEQARPGITLYALTSMHRSEIKIGNGLSATIVAGVDSKTRFVNATMDVKFAPEKVLLFPFLTTTLIAEDWCNGELNSPSNNPWYCPLKITSCMKLACSLTPTGAPQ